MVMNKSLGYDRAMATYRGTVTKRQLVVRGVDLPDGTEVDVTIDRPVFQLSGEDIEAIRESDAQFRRGEFVSREESIAELRRSVHGARRTPSPQAARI